MSMHNPKSDGPLVCYVCGCKDFEVHLNSMIGRVTVFNLSPFPDIETPTISTICCAKCGALHWVADKLEIGGRKPAWFIDNHKGKWNEETQQIEFPKYKREVHTQKEMSIGEMIKMLQKTGVSIDSLKSLDSTE